jgi:hypothetical protein
MTPMTLDEVRALCDMATYRNAEQIAAGDQLLHLARSDTTLYAQVQGSKPYTVRIEFKDGAPSAKCTCPAARFSKFCKHAIAVLIVWAQSPERFAYGQQTLMETPPAAPKRGAKRAAKATAERADLQTQALEQTLRLAQELAERGATGVQEAFLQQLRDSAANLQSLKTRRLQQRIENLVRLIEASRENPLSEQDYTRAFLDLWVTARAIEEHFTERRALPEEQLEEMLGRTWRDKDFAIRENLRLMELAYENIELATGFRLDISTLIDLDSGELLREMKIAPLHTGGREAQAFKPRRPAPFLATRVGVYPGYAPKRIKIYDAQPLSELRDALTAQALQHAHTEWHPLLERYLQQRLDPFAPREMPCLVRYHAIAWQDGQAWLADAQGRLVPLAVLTPQDRPQTPHEVSWRLVSSPQAHELLENYVPPQMPKPWLPEEALLRHPWDALFGYLEGEDTVYFRPVSGLHARGVAPLLFQMQYREY